MSDLLFNFTYLLVSALFIASVWWGTLRLLDKSAGIKFRAEFRRLETEPLAMALYLGLRLIALALLFAPLLRVVVV